MTRCLYSLAAIVLCFAACCISPSAAQHKDQAAFRLSPEEQELLNLTNQERKNQKLPPLRPDPILFKVARGHSANMARQEKMAHELDNKKPRDRVKEAGYRYYFMGENVAYGEVDLPEIMKGWMDSKKHRDNILNRTFTEIGLGLGRTDKGVVYYTQVFATPKMKD
jgi:uncharacterized protein YkwD